MPVRRSWILTALICAACVAPQTQPQPPTSGLASPTSVPTAPAATAREAPPAAAIRSWQRTQDIPTPRSEVAAALHPTGIYVIGGFGGLNRVERFTADSRWERVADLPHGVDHAMATGVSGMQFNADEGVYLLGGYVNGSATARSFWFDPRNGRWSEIAPMPGSRAAGAAVTTGSRIYVVGGAEGGRLVAPTYEYILSERRWRTVASIPTPRDHLAAAAFDGKVCAVGGRRLSMSANLGTFECYLPQEDKWETLPPAPTPRGGVGAAVYGRELYFIGGEQPQGTFEEVEIYDSRTGAWSRGPDLPTPRHGIGVVAVHGYHPSPPWGIYVLTGGPTPGGSQTVVCEILPIPR